MRRLQREVARSLCAKGLAPFKRIVYPWRMNIAELIDYHGGPTELAKKLGFTHPKNANRVVNWRARNAVPYKVQLEHPKIFGKAAVKKAEADLCRRIADAKSVREAAKAD